MERRTYYILIICVLLLKSGGILGQTISTDSLANRQRSIGVHSGIEHNLYLDPLTTPLIYKGDGVKFGISYQCQNTKSQININLEYATLNEIAKYHQDRVLYITPLEYFPEIDITGDTVLQARISVAKLQHFGLGMAYYKQLMPKDKKHLAINIGASIDCHLRIPPAENVIIFTPLWLNEFNLGIKGDYTPNSKIHISLGAEIALFSLAARLPYSISPVEPNTSVYTSAFSMMKVVSWNTYQSGKAYLVFEYSLRRRTALQLTMRCYYFHYRDPESIRFIQSSSTIGVTYNLIK